MSVLFLTIFISLLLGVFFGASFLYHHDYASTDPLRDSLLPFRGEGRAGQEGGGQAGRVSGEAAGAEGSGGAGKGRPGAG